MVSTANRLDRSLLFGVPAFAGLTGDELDDVLRGATARRYAKGAAVFEQGAAADCFYVLIDGRLKVVQVTPAGHQIVVRFVNPGELFGIAAAIGRHDYPATALAATESVALAWAMADWPRLVERYPAIAGNALRSVGARLQESHTRIREMSTERIERRIAHALLRLAQQAGQRTDAGVAIAFPISRQDIAEMTATTLHTVSRVMSAWEQDGIVEGGRQRVVIRDPHALVQIAEDLER
jgi:CRP/FNR family transcriptional regulator, nitrogen oxide reductase regulator